MERLEAETHMKHCIMRECVILYDFTGLEFASLTMAVLRSVKKF